MCNTLPYSGLTSDGVSFQPVTNGGTCCTQGRRREEPFISCPLTFPQTLWYTGTHTNLRETVPFVKPLLMLSSCHVLIDTTAKELARAELELHLGIYLSLRLKVTQCSSGRTIASHGQGLALQENGAWGLQAAPPLGTLVALAEEPSEIPNDQTAAHGTPGTPLPGIHCPLLVSTALGTHVMHCINAGKTPIRVNNNFKGYLPKSTPLIPTGMIPLPPGHPRPRKEQQLLLVGWLC